MPISVEEVMAKVLGVSPKVVEQGVPSVQAEAKQKVWDAVPMLAGEKLYLWFPRVARELRNAAIKAGIAKEVAQRWTPRRIRALWNGEAHRIDCLEMRIIDLRIQLNELDERATKRRETLNELAIGIATARADARATARRR
jgi:hypothetical protein